MSLALQHSSTAQDLTCCHGACKPAPDSVLSLSLSLSHEHLALPCPIWKITCGSNHGLLQGCGVEHGCVGATAGPGSGPGMARRSFAETNDSISNSRRSLQRLEMSPPCTLMIYQQQQQQQHCAVLQSSDLPSLMHCTLRLFPRPLGRQKQKRYRPSHDKLTVASLGLSGDHSSDPTDI